jgi:hypothetical protein
VFHDSDHKGWKQLTFFVFFLFPTPTPFTTSKLVPSIVAAIRAEFEDGTRLLRVFTTRLAGAWNAETPDAAIAMKGIAVENLMVEKLCS